MRCSTRVTDPYRDPEPYACPACHAVLRSFHDRLCCDACGGMMLALDDLAAAVTEIAATRGAHRHEGELRIAIECELVQDSRRALAG